MASYHIYQPPPPACTIRQTILVDSRDRDYAKFPTPNSYVVSLPITFRHVTQARLVSAEFPSSHYVFSAAKGNTTIRIGLDGTFHDVTIPDGNYSSGSMIAALVTALNAAFGAGTFSVSIESTTLTCTIAATGTVAVDTTTITSPAPTQWGLGYYLGFDKNVVATGSGSVTGPRVVTMNPELYLLMDVEGLSKIYETTPGGNSSKTFAKIPLAVDSFDFSFFSDKDIMTNYMDPPIAKLDQIRVSFRFHDGTPLDFQNVEHAFTIELMCAHNTR